MKKTQKGHPRLIAGDLMLKTQFGIKHFAAPVVYDASEFVERNMHRLPSELLHVISKTSNKMISEYFRTILHNAVDRLNECKTGSLPIAGRKRSSKKKAVLERFRIDLQGLMESMKGTEARYIRCVKPNETLTPGKVNHCTIMRQLECAGLVTAIDLSRETYPNKLPLATVEERFDCLLSQFDKVLLREMPPYDKVQYMLSKLYAPFLEMYRNCEFTLPYACGKTKVYFRSGALEMLESLRFEFYSKQAVVIQTYSRRWLAKQKVERAWKGLITMQACSRGYLDQKKFHSIRSLAVRLQSARKGKKERRSFLAHRSAAILLQSRWRFLEGAKRRRKERAASILIVAFIRKAIHRKRFINRKAKCTKLQALTRGVFVRKRFEYVVQTCVLLQSFGRLVIATNRRKRLASAATTIGNFGRQCVKKRHTLQACATTQSCMRRFLFDKRIKALQERKSHREKAGPVIFNFLLFATQRIRFIKLYVATVKIQTFLRMGFARTRFKMLHSACVKVQSFCRMTRERIRFITVYMATLKIQSFCRMATERIRYSSLYRGPIKGVLSVDASEIYTIATSDSKDALNGKIATEPQDPSTGILRQWMVGAFGNEEDSDSSSSSSEIQNPLLVTSQTQEKALTSSESLPSVTVESENSSCTSSIQPCESEEVPTHVDLIQTEEQSNKDRIIRKLRLELDDMKEQEKILREEIAAVVDLAKDHEQMVGEEFEDRINAYEEEVVQLKESLRESEVEKDKVRSEVEALRRDQTKQLEEYQRHAYFAQKSHKEYIRKVSQVLDEANKARKQETARILAEIDAMRQIKEAEIRKLKSEIMALRSMVKTGDQRQNKAGSSLPDSADLKAELHQLESAIMAAIKSDRVAVVVERAQRRPWSKEAFIDEKVSLRGK